MSVSSILRSTVGTASARRRNLALLVIGVGIGYFLLAETTALLSNGSVSIVWLSSGLSVAMGILFGPAAFIGAALGSLAFELRIGTPLLGAAAMALSNAGSEYLAARIMTSRGPLHRSRIKVSQVMRSVAGILTGSILSAVLGTTIYSILGIIPISEILTSGVLFFGSTVLGMSLFVPLFLGLAQDRSTTSSHTRPAEFVLYLVSAIVCGVIWKNPALLHVAHETALMSGLLIVIVAAMRLSGRTQTLVFPAFGLAAICTAAYYAYVSESVLTLPEALSIQFCTSVIAGIAHLAAAMLSEQSAANSRLLLVANVIENARDAIVITDADALVVDVNEAFLTLHGVTRDEAMGENTRIFKSGRHDDAFYAGMWDQLTTAGHWQGEIWNRRKGGSIFPKGLSITAVKDERGIVSNYVGISTDLSETKSAELQFRTLATQDPLTGLLNRSTLAKIVDRAISHARRSHNEVAAIFLDLDNFKRINDSLGHNVGDQLLVEVGRRLKAATRTADSVFRQGGDEFVIVVPDLNDHLPLEKLAARILYSLSAPYSIGSSYVHSSVSIGIAVFPADGSDTAELLSHADVAMYRAKELGRNRAHFFSASLREEFHNRVEVETDLRRSLDDDGFFLVYQPQVDLLTGRISSVEALVRWRTEDGTVVFPDGFISVAEDSGLIVPLGDWVTAQACRDLARLRSHGHDVTVAVNLSARELREADLIEKIDRALSASELDHDALELELIEDALINNPGQTAGKLELLREQGVKVALDDFGTGLSSFKCVQFFKPDRLKVDRSFTAELPESSEAVAFVLAAIALAKGLGVSVVAEGVETQEQLSFLMENGCSTVQGYLLAKPLEFDALERLLADWESSEQYLGIKSRADGVGEE